MSREGKPGEGNPLLWRMLGIVCVAAGFSAFGVAEIGVVALPIALSLIAVGLRAFVRAANIEANQNNQGK